MNARTEDEIIDVVISHPLFSRPRGLTVLTSAVPQVQSEASEEADLTRLDVNRRAQPPRVGRELRLEDDGAHRSLAAARFAHQEELSVGRGRDGEVWISRGGARLGGSAELSPTFLRDFDDMIREYCTRLLGA